jgi:ribosomal protein L11 methyltransferase
MNYLAYRFTVAPVQPGSEILMAMIADMGFESFDNTPTGFTAYIKDSEAHNVNLDDLVFEDFKFTCEIEKIEQKNWNAEWEKSFEPVAVDDRLLIRAPFHHATKKYQHEIEITPKMSFGTGHHQTTQLMCAAMFGVDLKMKRVLDMGCGTGVLAILAKKMGAKGILAIDIDEWSVENCSENCEINHCNDIVVLQGDINLLEKENPFDVILANINKNILKAHMRSYAKKLKPGGKLLLSGFFKTDVYELTRAAKNVGMQFVSDRSKGEWAMVILEKPF